MMAKRGKTSGNSRQRVPTCGGDEMSEWRTLDDEWFEGQIDGLDPYEAAETFAKHAHKAAIVRAVEVLEGMAETHDSLTESAREIGSTDSMRVHTCHANALREAAAKLREL